MTPTTLPAAPQSATLAPVQPNAAGAAQPAPTDFLLMLGQLIGAAPAAAAAGGAATPELKPAADETAGVEEQAVASVDVLGALPISLPVASTGAAVPPKAAATDMALELQLSREPAAVRVAMLAVDSQATSNLAQPTENAAPQIGFDGVLSAQSPTESQQPARVAMNSDSSMLSRPVQTPVGSAAWADEIGSRLTLMAEHGKQTASLRLSPEHLGPLEIRIAIHDDQASVWFGAAHADTRAAIEHALPRLRELFASQGMSLADAGVFHEPPREQPSANTSVGGSREPAAEESILSSTVSVNVGLVDAYA
jgi:flagellar hook-length control protein FliK